jgi:hypothetical protein
MMTDTGTDIETTREAIADDEMHHQKVLLECVYSNEEKQCLLKLIES